jgi:hypothetical protein
MTDSTHDATLQHFGLQRTEAKPPPQQPRPIEDIASKIYPHLIPNRDRKDRK